MSRLLKQFAAGFLATLVFHQGVVAALWAAKVIPRVPWNMAGVPPMGVPAVIQLAFWGGVWGIPVLWLLSRLVPSKQMPLALILGAIGPSLVAWYVVSPLKGRPPPDNLTAFAVGLAVNGAWGIGTLLFFRMMNRAEPRMFGAR